MLAHLRTRQLHDAGPHAASFEALNVMLAQRCRARQAEHAGRHATTIGERLVADTETLRALPSV